jgi:type I restriction enzyme R subunit
MDKKKMSEIEICMKYITPALEKSQWDVEKQIRREVSFTAGKIMVYGKTVKRGVRKRADYILYHKPNIPLAIIEAKDNKHSVGDGMQQGLEYSETLDLPFVFSSNGDGFVFHDKTTGEEKELTLSQFPSPEILWNKYKKYKDIDESIEDAITTNYYYEEDFKQPRYYQRIAINRTVEAIAKGQQKILLVMATGTGKTYTAFQIMHRLRNSGLKKRILYLADRNVLLDQPKNNDFKPFSKVITKISKRKVDKAYEVYLALYQGLTGNEEAKNIYKQFSKDFFDLVIVDECHRGSAKEESRWREVLEYFDSATQIGMTATPKETNKVSNIDYFGEPIYSYSLKEGIDDGFLAPFRVIKVATDKDTHGFRPKKGEKDKFENEIPDFVYGSREFDRTIVIEERDKVVAKKITEYLKKTDRFSKTIVFCVDIEHAERMRRALANENKDLYQKNNKYVMRITGDDKIGKNQLDNFIDPASRYPVIATTSKLMNTGVDAQTCKLIVLDSMINSMTEFKQIIGRGTRIREDYGKHYFTIMDFRNVTNHFADPDFDGEPIQLYTSPKGKMEVKDIEEEGAEELQDGEQVLVSPDISMDEGDGKVRKYYVKKGSTEVTVINQTVQHLDPSGKLITESLEDYTKKGMKKEFRTLNDFIQKWNIVDQKRAIIEELQKEGILLDALREEYGKEYDPFDLILKVAYGQKPMTRSERAKNIKKDERFKKYSGKAQKVIEVLLEKYSDEGIENFEDPEVLKVPPLTQFGRPLEIMKLFGGKLAYLQMIKEIEKRLYKERGK